MQLKDNQALHNRRIDDYSKKATTKGRGRTKRALEEASVRAQALGRGRSLFVEHRRV